MLKTPKGLRLHIAIFGRRNVGKSSVLNALTGQSISIVSEKAGTTTDPVEKAMELLPIGPVLFIDTAGMDDTGALGKLRVKKSAKIFDRADVVLLVTETNVFGPYEKKILDEAKKRKVPVIAILNKSDIVPAPPNVIKELKKRKTPFVQICASEKNPSTTATVKEKLISVTPAEFLSPPGVIADLIEKNQTIILVIPIDKEAPKGRLILPQQMILREILDKKAVCMIVNENNLKDAIKTLKKKPSLVVTDSQAFETVLLNTPKGIPLTSFSILLARAKGDIKELAAGVNAVKKLKNGSLVLIAEACTHHPIGEDIGRVKIPGWLREKTGKKLIFDVRAGRDYPEDLKKYDLIVHCGSCMLNRKETLNRIFAAKKAGVPITNYGTLIAYLHGGLKRSLTPLKIK
ncbi:MAG: [FeFe] hydrogenase H-cluster maturation GTPase HydF [Elusimicrobiota bacterium]|nr:[FeFe] hydrogenase H-cluster maturation GTPase HydF [Elusimicrobiota bacterium]